MGLEYDFKRIDYKESDDRGRVTLGADYANEDTIMVAWSVVDIDDAEIVDPPEDVKEKLKELWSWANENGHKMMDSDPYEGRILNENAEWVDTDIAGLEE